MAQRIGRTTALISDGHSSPSRSGVTLLLSASRRRLKSRKCESALMGEGKKLVVFIPRRPQTRPDAVRRAGARRWGFRCAQERLQVIG